MCIYYCFQHPECGHYTDNFTLPCGEWTGSNVACPHSSDDVVVIPWFISLCDACFAPTDNTIPAFTLAVDLDRKELRAPAKLYLASFLDHISRHGPESRFAINRETFRNLPIECLEEAKAICSALENKIRWDSQRDRNHTLAEKQMILDLRAGIQSCVVKEITSLPATTSDTPYNIFCELTPAHRNIVFGHVLRERCAYAGTDIRGRELVSPLCSCEYILKSDLERLTLVHEPALRCFTATCKICDGKMSFLKVRSETRPSDIDHRPWWLLMLQGVSAIGTVTATGHAQPGGLIRRTTTKVQRSGSKVARSASTRVAHAGSSLLRSLTGKSIKEKK